MHLDPAVLMDVAQQRSYPARFAPAALRRLAALRETAGQLGAAHE